MSTAASTDIEFGMEEYRVERLRGSRTKDVGVRIEFKGRTRIMAESNLCLYNMPNGTVQCASCDHPPANSTIKGPAPEGLAEGNYAADDPALAGHGGGGGITPTGEGET